LRETAVVEIYDVHGKLIQSTEKDCMRGVNQVELETMSLIEGVYFIKVKLGAYETYTRILKMDK